jgi:hypothetical protein
MASREKPTLVSPGRGAEPPGVPSLSGEEELSSSSLARRDEPRVGRTWAQPVRPAAGWEPKPVAVLVIEATWPDMSKAEGRPYEPWTIASRWSETITEKVAGFGGILLQDSPALCLVAFGLPKTLEQLPQRAIQAALAIRHLTADTHTFTREMPRPVVRLAAHLGTLLVAEATGESPWRWLAVGEVLVLPVRLLGHAMEGGNSGDVGGGAPRRGLVRLPAPCRTAGD